jgi:hypothetical protein
LGGCKEYEGLRCRDGLERGFSLMMERVESEIEIGTLKRGIFENGSTIELI